MWFDVRKTTISSYANGNGGVLPGETYGASRDDLLAERFRAEDFIRPVVKRKYLT